MYPELLALAQDPARDERAMRNVVAAVAEGYAFPTNLDLDQPIGSLAPPAQVDTVLAALADDLTPAQLDVALRDQDDRRIP